jgi:hypothetical protein
MMQGNSGNFADDNPINGDGALFIRFADGDRGVVCPLYHAIDRDRRARQPQIGSPPG